MSLREDLIRHEGLRLFPYRDSRGLLTIGVGRNIEHRGISREEALYLLDNDIRDHTDELLARFPVVATLHTYRRDVLINMAFNMGIPALSGFKRMWSAIQSGDYRKASDEMLDSQWALQVGDRAGELANIMMDGDR